jgi:hypothetical protein
MDSEKVVDKRSVRLEEVMKPDYIPFLGGRPQRDTIISIDEIVNLVIALNTTDAVEYFIDKI